VFNALLSAASKRAFASFSEYSSGVLAMTDESPKLTNTNRGLYAALLLDEKPWSWNWKFNPNLKEHMHALGVIAANYNELEGHFYLLFYLTLNKFEVGKIIFSKLNNAERIETALKLAETEPANFRDLFRYFISGYGIASENRNILMHSKAHNAWPYDISVSHLTLAKPSKKSPDENNFISLDVPELRSIADDMARFGSFGFDLFLWRLALLTGGILTWADGDTTTPTLPRKPPEPRRLLLSPQEVPTSAPPQPQSSGE
jgi:hypothetical protein